MNNKNELIEILNAYGIENQLLIDEIDELYITGTGKHFFESTTPRISFWEI